MPDPISLIGGGAIAAYIGKDGLEKLLGPTASYLGDTLKEITKSRVENIGKIFKRGEKKLGEKANQKGQIPPKLLNTILGDASFNEDDLSIEYFGGILASSKSDTGRDDRGASVAKLLDSLSTYQIRAHYILYKAFIEHYKGGDDISDSATRAKIRAFMPMVTFTTAMEFSAKELEDISRIFSHTLFGLYQYGLLENFEYGDVNHMKTFMPDIRDAGVGFVPSVKGLELLAWGLGIGDKDHSLLFSGGYIPPEVNIPNCNLGVIVTK
ncbi:hypothetical protein CWC48_09020 [Pseudomonas sp. S10E 269]|jgi:hypothetical protein|uniref:hypothetical protein n=1 Tax=unclassified Pseudomonas TaxID=196821 RepID=UPI000C26ACB2|nr:MULTISPECIES: hypothetical protein [unclassified Pseudomonas]PJK35328.1 hypothetical protein CWC49_19180 [Pseudomonas sp. S09F 262]PJK39268.1 hypothetical protein CWC48_09020 [Pseudomonas sp. S10E 269]